MASQYPTHDQLRDVFNNASTALVHRAEDGSFTSNAAAVTLFGSKAGIEKSIADLVHKFGSTEEIVNAAVETESDQFPVAVANVATVATDAGTRLYVAARPQLGSALPASITARPESANPGAQQWIDAVAATSAQDVTDNEFLRDVFDNMPVAIHVIASDGTVVAANQRDIDLVGASEDPSKYVGGHIRRIYADQDVVDDFLSRWNTDGPIIDFRAHFLNKTTREPVVIFSTAQVEERQLVNTRCFVFNDDQPTWPRDEAVEVHT